MAQLTGADGRQSWLRASHASTGELTRRRQTPVSPGAVTTFQILNSLRHRQNVWWQEALSVIGLSDPLPIAGPVIYSEWHVKNCDKTLIRAEEIIKSGARLHRVWTMWILVLALCSGIQLAQPRTKQGEIISGLIFELFYFSLSNRRGWYLPISLIYP